MKVWIDFSNSPHPLLFAPVVARLGELGHDVVLTARDHAQTLALARERWPETRLVGTSSPRDRARKAVSVARRVLELRQFAVDARPDVALSHNSYAQVAAARATGVPDACIKRFVRLSRF